MSIFGPGKGECVVVHLGGGRWMVVDSCRPKGVGRPIALEYLDTLGVDVAESVVLVVATHAHDDHFAGIAEVLDAAKSASFVCSSAATSEEFLAAVEIDEHLRRLLRRSALDEYRRIHAICMERRRLGQQAIRWGIESRSLWTSDDGATVVSCLSPSDEAVTRAREAFARAMVTAGERKRLLALDPNELAVAIWIQFGDVAVLLGADLPNGPKGCGWEAVLGSHSPTQRASLYKVAHHGSPTSHHPDVWTQLLSDRPVQLLSPYRPGRRPLPAPADVERLKALGDTYVTALPTPPTPNKELKRIRAELGGIALSVRDPWGEVGQVRARVSEGGGWNVEAYRPARQL